LTPSVTLELFADRFDKFVDGDFLRTSEPFESALGAEGDHSERDFDKEKAKLCLLTNIIFLKTDSREKV
jgi:hypothetical protein